MTDTLASLEAEREQLAVIRAGLKKAVEEFWRADQPEDMAIAEGQQLQTLERIRALDERIAEERKRQGGA